MNSVLEGSGISFNLENVSRTTNNLCASGLANVQTFDSLKAELHQGNASTLNIVYVQTNQGRGLKGMCTMPPPGIDVASKIGRRDGCVVAMDTLPRGNGSDSIDGVGGVLITTTHEMGHWLTLEHVKEAGEALGPGGQAGGVFGRLFRRRRGSSIGNVMEPWSMYVSPPSRALKWTTLTQRVQARKDVYIQSSSIQADAPGSSQSLKRSGRPHEESNPLPYDSPEPNKRLSDSGSIPARYW